MAKPASVAVTPLEATAIGALSGAIEVTIMQPTVSMKNAMQQGRPLPMSPAALYRGLLINATSVAPITATQFGANRFYEGSLKNFTGRELGQAERIGVAMAAGCTSALISCPSELIMIQQQTNGTSLATAFKTFMAEHGLVKIYRGMSPTLAREGLYTAGYLGICPALLEYFRGAGTFQGYPEGLPMAVAGVTGGLFASVGTQWADTIKTRMQSNLDPSKTPQYRGMLSTASTILSDGGIRAMWAGTVPRMVRIVGATFILNWTRTGMTEFLEERKRQQLPLPSAVATSHGA